MLKHDGRCNQYLLIILIHLNREVVNPTCERRSFGVDHKCQQLHEAEDT